MTLSLANITVDCADTLAISAFWSAALGRPVDEGSNERFAAIGPPSEGGPRWLFIKVPEGKVAKNRMHVDFRTQDRLAEAERLIGLGARRVGEHDEDGVQWVVMVDPEGNEFCVAGGS